MTATFDAFMVDAELAAVMTGLPMTTAPVLIDRGSGASVACYPIRIDGGPCFSFAWCPGMRRPPRPRDNAWVGILPIEPDVPEANLSLVTGETVRNITIRRREPEPSPVLEPMPKPMARRARKAKVRWLPPEERSGAARAPRAAAPGVTDRVPGRMAAE
jgi:hypothetical protein